MGQGTAPRLVLGLLGIVALGCDTQIVPQTREGYEPYSFQGNTMGTSYRVSVVWEGALDQALKDRWFQAVASRLEEIESRMSTYREDSELSRFNRTAASQEVTVSSDTLEVVKRAIEIAEETAGAFDPSVLPAVELWGFGAKGRRSDEPTEDEVRDVLGLIDLTALTVNADTRVLSKGKAGLTLGLAGIAKGYAVDEVCEVLEQDGATDYLVEIGGEVRTKGLNRHGEPWLIGIERPRYGIPFGGDPLELRIRLPGLSAATSGDYRNYIEVDGRRFSHTIDPRTARPIVNRLASVTVVAPRCMDADAYATAVSVLGLDAGRRFVESTDRIEAFFVWRAEDGEGFQTAMTDGFKPLVVEEEGEG